MATDPSGNQASATFHITVLGARAQLGNLESAVVGPGLANDGIARSLAAKLDAALEAVTTVVTTMPSPAGAGRRATRVSASNDNGQRQWSLAGAASGAEGPAFESRLAHEPP